jgi:hypothetical protein
MSEEIKKVVEVAVLSELDTDFKSDDEIIAMLPRVRELLSEVIDTYIDIEPQSKEMLVAWIMAAPYYESFFAFPYLYVNASKASGKTRLLKLIAALIPESIMVVSLSESALFRVGEVKKCMLIDEAERLHSKEKQNLMDLLNSGYKKGGKILRVEGDKTKVVREFSAYYPKVLANIWGLDTVLESKCLNIVLQKTENQQIIHMPEMFELDTRIISINKYFEASLVYVGCKLNSTVLKPLYDSYANLYININHTHPTSSYTNSEDNDFVRGMYDVHVDGRNYELWLPLLATSYTVSKTSYTNLLEVAKAKISNKQDEDLTSDRDTSVAVELYDYLTTNGSTHITPKLFAESLEDGMREWCNPEWLGRFFKRTGLLLGKTRKGHGYEYDMDMSAVKKYLRARQALIESEAKADDTIKSLPLTPSPQTVICPSCSKEVKLTSISEYGGKMMCIDCMNKIQHQDDEIDE